MAQIRRREATPAEFKAVAHPLRMRIVRLCLHESLTNKEIADRLDKNPATVLHHVRILAESGFLRGERPRTGARGALEKPYRATNKSLTLSWESFPADARQATHVAMIDAVRGELIASGPDSVLEFSRVGLKLNDDAVEELHRRLEEIVVDYKGRGDDADGKLYSLFVALHERT